ncbi:MAG: BON domain-containing protein [Chloroflexota bacterium]
MGRLFSAVLGAALGAAAALLFDPDRGHSRRVRLTDQAGALVRRTRRSVGRQRRLLLSRTAGRIAALRARGHASSPANDATLKERIESELLRDRAIPKGAININAEQGIVVLRGEVPDAAMRAKLEERAAAIRGVRYVENLLHLPGEPAPTLR